MVENIKRWVHSRKWLKVLSFMIFCFLVLYCFLKVTYLFRRPVGNRVRLTAFKEERNIDVVCIGGSCTFVYWQPARAWQEYGITSYDYAINTIQAETLLGYIREVRKTLEPELFIIDLRPFQYWTDAADEAGVRNGTDSIDFSLNHWKMVYDYFNKHTFPEDTDKLSYYFDIALYHTNLESLAEPENWRMMDNTGVSPANGFVTPFEHEALSVPTDFLTDDREQLAPGSQEILLELLNYCKKEELQVLFVVCPYWITKEHMMLYNSMKDIIESNGFMYLNVNEYYDEMGIDFGTDFYNINHVNAYGAEKYTSYLAEYIQKKCEVKDHRGEPGMEEWEKMDDSNTTVKKYISDLIEMKESSYLSGKELSTIENPYEWYLKALNENYYLLIETQGMPWNSSKIGNNILKGFNIAPGNTSDVVRIFMGTTKVFEADEELEENFKGRFEGHSVKENYEINCGTRATIMIQGVDYCKGRDGINIVVYDKNYQEILDSITLVQNEMCEMELVR